MILVIVAVLIVRLIIGITPGASHLVRWVSMTFNRIYRNKNIDIFDNNYIEVKAFYIRQFGTTPCISFINNVDAAKVYEYINGGNAGQVFAIYQRNYYSWQQHRLEFSKTIFRLKNKVMIELGTDYAEILFEDTRYEYANNLVIFSWGLNR